MLLVLPVCPRDLHLAISLGVWLSELDAAQKHSLLILFDSQVSEEDRATIRAIWSHQFDSTRAYSVTAPEGWPQGANEMFKVACILAKAQNLPWYFFEPDNTPTQSGWLDQLEKEYHAQGRPFMGALEMEYLEPTPGQLLPIGRYLMGSAIYPPNVGQHTVVFTLPIEKPFDLAMKSDLIDQQLVRETRQIANHWNTQHYRLSGKQIVCTASPLRAGQKGHGLTRELAFPLPLVVHGCKDGSLICLLSHLRLNKPELLIASAHDAEETRALAESGNDQQHADAISGKR